MLIMKWLLFRILVKYLSKIDQDNLSFWPEIQIYPFLLQMRNLNSLIFLKVIKLSF